MTANMAIEPDPIPRWMRIWLYVTAVIFLQDGLFCILRPHSFPDGKLGMVFFCYWLYVEADKHYADTVDVFIFSQGICCIVEAIMCLSIVFNVLNNVRKTKMLAIVLHTMIFWKTILFLIYSLDIPRGGHVVHSWLYEILVLGTPLIWIAVPIYIVYTFVQEFLHERSSGPDDYKTEDTVNDDVMTKQRYNLRNRQLQ